MHFRAGAQTRPGDVVEVEVTSAAPHHLVADAPLRAYRATRAGDVWAVRQTSSASSGVLVGMPRVPARA